MMIILKKSIRLILGFLLCASSTVFMLNSNLGLSPWDVFHQGISNVTGITIGEASILTSVLVVLIGIMLKQKIGIGTLLNILFVGKFIDIINESNIIPVANSLFSGIVMMIIGMFVMGYGCYLYIGCEIGCGPRDGLMIGLSQKLNKQIKIVRGSIEISVLIIGFLLGGAAGLGTFISAVGLGYCMQVIFKMCKFDVVNIRHKAIMESLEVVNIFNK
ncbi:putative membrane protein YczE [Clostridium tertium]|nr:putative membrane protein YczE [Clostridium tertium]